MVTGEIGELIERAGLGLANWDDVNKAMTATFPGTFSVVSSQNRQSGFPNFMSFAGLSSKQIDDYFTHYAQFNPWNDCWIKVKSGHVLQSEKHYPVDLFSRNEFVNDWLRPIHKRSASVGIKLTATAEDDVFMGVHFDTPLLEQYEDRLTRLLEEHSGRIVRAVEMNRFLADHATESVAAAALVERGSSIGLVVDINLKVIEANQRAAKAFHQADLLTASKGTARFCDQRLQQWLTDTVRFLLMGAPVNGTTFVLRRGRHVWQVKLSRVPEHDSRGGNRMFMPRHLVMILITDIARPHADGIDTAQLSALGLTGAEIRLCLVLMQGRTIAQAADTLAITPGTARQRLKDIFAKTGLNRQADLLLLLSRTQ